MTKQTVARREYVRPELSRVELASVAGLAMACCKLMERIPVPPGLGS